MGGFSSGLRSLWFTLSGRVDCVDGQLHNLVSNWFVGTHEPLTVHDFVEDHICVIPAVDLDERGVIASSLKGFGCVLGLPQFTGVVINTSNIHQSGVEVLVSGGVEWVLVAIGVLVVARCHSKDNVGALYPGEALFICASRTVRCFAE